jgi:hypothetical protein
VHIPPRRREKAEGLAITQGQRRILTNELQVGKSIEERRLKDLIKASVTEMSKQALTAKLEVIQEQNEVLKVRKKEKEGVGAKIAKREEKKTEVYIPPHRREKAENLAIAQGLEKILANELTVGNATDEYGWKTVRGKKKRKYRPLTEDALRDTISKEQGADDQVRPFKERSWVKPKSVNKKTLGIKIKEAIVKRTKEKKAWGESGRPCEEWAKSRQEERLKRRWQKGEAKKDDEWPKLVSKTGSVTSTSSRAPWEKGLERSIEFELRAVGKAEARKGHGFDIEPRTVERIEKR